MRVYVDFVVSARSPLARGCIFCEFMLLRVCCDVAVLCLLAVTACARGCCVCLTGVAVSVVFVCMFVVAYACSRSVQLIICLFEFTICFCMQNDSAKLQRYCDRIKRGDSAAAALAITVADVIDGIACVMPKDMWAARKFCDFMWLIAIYARSSGCDVILEAGAIPVVFGFLRSWPRERVVVEIACGALFRIAVFGSEIVKSAMRSVPDCEALLIAAHKSKLDGGDVSKVFGDAAPALKELGYKKPGCQCAIM